MRARARVRGRGRGRVGRADDAHTLAFRRRLLEQILRHLMPLGLGLAVCVRVWQAAGGGAEEGTEGRSYRGVRRGAEGCGEVRRGA